MPALSSEMFLVLLPEIGLLLLAAILLTLSILKIEKLTRNLTWFTGSFMFLILILTAIFSRPQGEPVLLWGEMVRYDYTGYVFKLFFLAGAGLTALFACSDETLRPMPEFFILLVISTIGLNMMASAGHLIMLFLAIETASFPLYIMAGIKIRDEKSVESGIKYFLFGGMSSAIMLFGFSLLYGFSGTMHIFGMSERIAANHVPLAALILASIMVIAGLAYKLSVFPFHFWAPDVYEGSPTPISGYLCAVSKAAGFAALIRILVHVFSLHGDSMWMILITIITVVSMFLGNLLAIQQKNLKRMFAYGSIAQAGYILIGVVSGTEFGFSSTIYYLMTYLVANIVVFAIVGWVERQTGSANLDGFAGLNRRAPGIALLMMIALLSLGGIPPFGGFFAKFLVFSAAIEAGKAWLTIIGVVNSVISLFFYLRVMKMMYLNDPDREVKFGRPSIPCQVAMGLCILGIIVMGIIFSPWFGLAQRAAASF